MKVWISHSLEDIELALKIMEYLKLRGFEIASFININVGMNFVNYLSNEIQNSDAIIVLLSKDSQSKYISSEIALGIYKNLPIFPVLVDKNAQIPSILENILYLDISDSDNFSNDMDLLIDAIKSNKDTKYFNENLKKNQRLLYQAEYTDLIREKNTFESKKILLMSKSRLGFLFLLSGLLVITLFNYWIFYFSGSSLISIIFVFIIAFLSIALAYLSFYRVIR